MNIPTLDEVVFSSLDFFAKNLPPRLDLSSFSLPFVVGSGNAINTGKILFSNHAAIFADESNFKTTVAAYDAVIQKELIKDTVIISASGEKDSVWEIELAKQKGLKTTLLTCKPQSSAAKVADTVLLYKSIAEPYTYNTSTYLGMVLSATHEDPKAIFDYLKSLVIPTSFNSYDAYAFILCNKYLNVGPMISIKRDELFGPHVMIRAYTVGHARHAKFVHPWNHELVMCLGEENRYFGDPEHRWDIKIPPWSGFGTMIALSYYLCGLIQRAKPDYYKQDIEKYCNDYGPKAYKKTEPFEVIVPANS